MAMPIFDFSGNPVGAISTSAPKVRLDEEKRVSYARQIITSTSGVTNLLGGPVPPNMAYNIKMI